MPYIKEKDRPKFGDLIQNVVHLVTDGNESDFTKGEYFGFWANRVVRRFVGDPDYTSPSFNSNFFNADKQKHLLSNADKLSAMLNRSEPLEAAGELNYIVSSVYWGLLGEAAGVDSARYGSRAYLRGILETIKENVQMGGSPGNQRDRTLSFRRWLIVKGVLGDVITEAYRRLTSDYEDQKINENGDIWADGKLV